jgi:hypothetical protein
VSAGRFGLLTPGAELQLRLPVLSTCPSGTCEVPLVPPIRSTRSPRGAHRDRGAIAVLVVMVVAALSASVLVALERIGGDLRDAQRARTAADAAALAGVHGGRPAAAGVAVANGGELVGWLDLDDTVTVDVRVGGAVARARATDAP